MATSRRSSLAKMRLCIFASIFELLPLVQSSDNALLLKVRITSKCKQLAYIRQGSIAETCQDYSFGGDSGSRRALRFAGVAGTAAVDERTKVQRTLGACRESCRITIWAVRRGPSFPARNTLSSTSTLSSSASKVQTSRFGSTSITPRASLSLLAFTEGCR